MVVRLLCQVGVGLLRGVDHVVCWLLCSYSFRGFVVWALMFALLVLLLGVVVCWFGLFVMCLVCVDVIVFLVNSVVWCFYLF